MQTQTFPLASTVIDASLNETLGASGSNPTALQPAALLTQLDVINRTFVNAPYKQEPSFGFEWMEKEGGYNFLTYAHTTLDGAITTSSTTIDLVDATNFPDSGRIWIKTTNGSIDYIDYTGKSTNQLTGVTNIGIPHADSEKVEMLYALPSDYGKAISLLINQRQLYDYVKTRTLPWSGTYTDRGAYLVFQEDIGPYDATLYYYKSPTAISTVGTSLDIPTDYQRYAIEMLKAYIYRVDGQDERVKPSLDLAQMALDDALSYATSTTTSLGLRATY